MCEHKEHALNRQNFLSVVEVPIFAECDVLFVIKRKENFIQF